MLSKKCVCFNVEKQPKALEIKWRVWNFPPFANQHSFKCFYLASHSLITHPGVSKQSWICSQWEANPVVNLRSTDWTRIRLFFLPKNTQKNIRHLSVQKDILNQLFLFTAIFSKRRSEKRKINRNHLYFWKLRLKTKKSSFLFVKRGMMFHSLKDWCCSCKN